MAFVDCEFHRNALTTEESTGGGAIAIKGGGDNGRVEITNCLFVANLSPLVGGALYLPQGMVAVANCTFVDNLAVFFGSAIFGNDYTTVANTIIRGSTDQLYGVLCSNITYSNVQGLGSNCTMGTNIDADPQFVNPSAGNYRLSSCNAPGVDGGHHALGEVPPDTYDVDEMNGSAEDTPDLDFAARIQGSEVDMGAYERGSEAPCAADTNHDGQVSVPDLLNVINDWSPGPQTHNGNVAPVSGCSVTGHNGGCG